MKVVRLAENSIEEVVQEAAEVLKAGGIVVYPTDTLYGLGASMLNEEAVRLLHTVKGRDDSKFFSFIVADLAQAERYAYLNEDARKIAEKYLPGPLTLVLPARDTVPSSIAVDGVVRIRIPNDSFALSLARSLGVPFAATSANRSGLPTQAIVVDIIEQFGSMADRIHMVVDDGSRDGGAPSTVIRFIDEQPEVVREGVISREELGL